MYQNNSYNFVSDHLKNKIDDLNTTWKKSFEKQFPKQQPAAEYNASFDKWKVIHETLLQGKKYYTADDLSAALRQKEGFEHMDNDRVVREIANMKKYFLAPIHTAYYKNSNNKKIKVFYYARGDPNYDFMERFNRVKNYGIREINQKFATIGTDYPSSKQPEETMAETEERKENPQETIQTQVRGLGLWPDRQRQDLHLRSRRYRNGHGGAGAEEPQRELDHDDLEQNWFNTFGYGNVGVVSSSDIVRSAYHSEDEEDDKFGGDIVLDDEFKL